jgi:hypothetical protein
MESPWTSGRALHLNLAAASPLSPRPFTKSSAIFDCDAYAAAALRDASVNPAVSFARRRAAFAQRSGVRL